MQRWGRRRSPPPSSWAACCATTGRDASSALPAAVVDEIQRGFATGDTAALVTGLQSD